MLRIAFAVFLALHGVAHLVGFAGSFQLGEFRGKPLDTTLLGGRIDVGRGGIRAMGVAWLLTAVAFVAVAGAVWADAAGWPTLTAVVAGVSLVLSVLGWPAARVGVFLNLAILAGIALAG